ncbi:MAG TPA: monofunctional biosynthetic peptidoglycan transglycosylase, partial [Arachidicoccus soli]|nr:monofunctional biosynthetic peptidoglycan transglycosylase [Arachidicoccus soli]
MKKIIRKFFKTILVLLLISIAYTIVCRWIMPPITITQLGSLFAGNGLRRDYVSWDEISSNAKLAAIAGEDQ